MEIPKSIIYKNRRYELVKEYPSFILYRNKETGLKETFHRYELGMIEETTRIATGYHRDKTAW